MKEQDRKKVCVMRLLLMSFSVFLVTEFVENLKFIVF